MLSFRKVQQLLLNGPSESVLELFDVDEGDDVVSATDISYHNEPYLVTVVASIEDNEKLDNFLELEKDISFKNLDEAKRIVSYYSIAKKVALRVDKCDYVRIRYRYIVGCPFVCLIPEVKKGKGFEINTLQTKYTYLEAFKNKRATQQALTYYFKKKVQNNPKYKVIEIRKNLNDNFALNISYSKIKRVKSLVLEKLKGIYVDDFNKLEGYAQALRDSNLGTDVVIKISKEALLEYGQRNFLR
ncbi:hypothetical protein H5410_062494, partial [Solanum commersonii]